MAGDQKKQTRVDVAYESVRTSILSGRFLPGRRLKFSELAQDCGASMSVLREALARLTAEGLVTNEPNVGYAVTEVSEERLLDLTEARIALEGMVFERSICEGDLMWESQIVAAHHRLAGTAFWTDTEPIRVTESWAEAHADFHRALLSGCRNQRLLQLTIALRDEAELYRRWSQHLGEEKNRDLPAEHRELLDLALARDAQRAVDALREHIAHTTRLLVKAADQLQA